MKITIETFNFKEFEKILHLIQQLNIKNIQVTSNNEHKPTIIKGDKSANPKALFGVWKDNPRDLKMMRQKAWSRNWEL